MTARKGVLNYVMDDEGYRVASRMDDFLSVVAAATESTTVFRTPVPDTEE
jgi:hypothetical protein